MDFTRTETGIRRPYMKVATVAVALAMPLSACTDPYYNNGIGPKTATGAAIGAAGGGLLAAATGGHEAGIAAGVLLGGLLGGAIGSALDAQDRRIAQQTAYHSLETYPSGQTSSWRNPDTGHYGTFTPTNTYQAGGQHCREYTQTIYVDGRQETARGTACRNPDGTWRIVS
jgi:surface antigen